MRLFLVVALAAALATGLIFDVPYYSDAVAFVTGGLKWVFIALVVLVAFARKKWLSGTLLLVFVAALILGLLNAVPWINTVLEWLALVVILGLFGFFFFLRDVHNKGKRKVENEAKTSSSEAPKPAAAAHDKDHVKHTKTGVKWVHIFLLLATFLVVFQVAGVFVVGIAGSNFRPHTIPSVDFVSAPEDQVKTCPESETLAPGEISSTFENVPDGQNLTMLPNLSEETVVIYMGSTGHLCGPETANTDRWCVKNTSDKPVIFSCSK